MPEHLVLRRFGHLPTVYRPEVGHKRTEPLCRRKAWLVLALVALGLSFGFLYGDCCGHGPFEEQGGPESVCVPTFLVKQIQMKGDHSARPLLGEGRELAEGALAASVR